MKKNFKNFKKTWIQLTDGSVISMNYLLDKSYMKLDIDSKSHKLWRFNSKNVSELSSIDKRILNFNKRFNRNKNN
jgi:ribosomal protein L31|tara:strand:+ start:53 stop:277 length:225 start_codon:yes stop_codon:yes gene_type:complete